MKLFGAIYIGSYEVSMKIFQINRNKSLKEIDSLKMPTDIVRDVIKKESISFDTTERLCKVLNDMKRVMNEYKVDDFAVYAGNNLGQASNDLFVLEQIKLKTGLKVKIISNSEQRFLGYEAISSIDGFQEMIGETALLVDVSGVVVQITLFSKGKIVTTQHLHIGTVTVGESLKKLSNSLNSSEQVFEMIHKEMDVFKTMFLKDYDPKYLILMGAQANTIASLTIGINEKLIVTVDEYKKALKKLNKRYLRDLQRESNIYLENEELVEPFVMLHESVIDSMDPDFVVIPGMSVCDGIAYDYCYKKKLLVSPHDFEEDVLSAAWAIAKRYGSYIPHLKTLDKFSMAIFDAMKKYHGMGARERLLMRVVAILHDCGKYISISESSDCSYTIIMSSEILGLTHIEREMIATAVVFNRKELQPYAELSDRFTEAQYVVIVKLLAILKVANALDRSHKQKSQSFSMSVKDNKLNISIQANSSIALEKGLFAEKADFFEKIFAIKPVLKEKRSNS